MMRDKLQILKVFLLECFIWVGFFFDIVGGRSRYGCVASCTAL